MVKLTGAEILTTVLEQAGIEVVSGIPGHTVTEFALAVGNRESMKTILPRHESTSAFAADVYYRVSGKLMVAFTHAFPGAGNAITAVSNAYADYSSLFFVTGNTASAGIGRGGYQELSRQINDDLTQMLRPAAKRVWTPRHASDIAHNALAALREATSGRPGPVVLNISQEIFSQEVEVENPEVLYQNFVLGRKTRPLDADVAAVARKLAQASRPVILAGNGVNLGRARSQLRAFAKATNIPVATTVSGKGAFNETDPLSVGVAGWTGAGTANFATREADLILVLGARLSEATASSWTEGKTFGKAPRIIQVDIEESAIANAYPVDDALIGHMEPVLEALTAAMAEHQAPDRSAWFDAIEAERRAWQEIVEASQAPGQVDEIGTGAVVKALRKAVSGPINLVNDCGKHHKWVAQQFTAHEDDYIVSSMGGASMGIGLAGAIGAALARPEAQTVAWVGDGGLAMSLSALPTLAEYNLPVVVVVIDDAAYGVVRNSQLAMTGRHAFALFDGSGTNPDYRLDFAEVAKGIGIEGVTVSDPAKLDEALAHAVAQKKPYVVNIRSAITSSHPAGGGDLRTLAETSKHLVWK